MRARGLPSKLPAEGSAVPPGRAAGSRRGVGTFRGQRLMLLADSCHSGGLGEVAKALSGARQTVALTSSEASNTSTGNWTFTQTLIDGFSGRALLDRNDDDSLTFGELATEVGEAVLEKARIRF